MRIRFFVLKKIISAKTTAKKKKAVQQHALQQERKRPEAVHTVVQEDEIVSAFETDSYWDKYR